MGGHITAGHATASWIAMQMNTHADLLSHTQIQTEVQQDDSWLGVWVLNVESAWLNQKHKV